MRATILPLTAQLRPRVARLVASAYAVLGLAVLFALLSTIAGIGEATMSDASRVAFSAVFILCAAVGWLRPVTCGENRRAWTLLAVALTLAAPAWSLWFLWLSRVADPPIPSVCDVLWFAGYPFLFASVLTLVNGDFRQRLPIGVWLDGVIAGAGMAAIGGAILLPPALASATGTAAAVATELAYPVIDMILLGLLFGVLALRGWRWDRLWGLLMGGLLVAVCADIVSSAQVASGSPVFGALIDLLYVAEFTAVALATWQLPAAPAPRRLEHWSVLLLPTGFTVGSIALLVYNQFARLPVPAFALAIGTLLAASLRMGLAFRDIAGLADVRRQALTDELTELPNRRLFMKQLQRAMTAARPARRGVSVLMLDLDNFKQLNDTLGHDAGDELLRLIGPRLTSVVRASDVVARLGGDEFAVLLDPGPDHAAVGRVAEDIMQALREPFRVQGLALRITGSVGVATYPDHARGPDELLKCADVAMYLAKDSRLGWERYATERDTNSRERLVLATDLAAALERGGIVAHFQPIADARSRRIVGAEALVRWRRPDGRMLPPNDFVSAAEHSGLSRPLTRRMLMLALEQVAGWRQSGQDLYVSVNTTVADLLDTSFPEEVGAALYLHDVPASALILEVTEREILCDPERIGAVLGELRELGVGLALDDFGTGYSSLAHLRDLSVQQVKVDRSFVSAMQNERTDAAIVYATIELAHKLGLSVVAEGVEDEATWQALVELGCDRIQGYRLGRPVGPAEFQRLLMGRPDSRPAFMRDLAA